MSRSRLLRSQSTDDLFNRTLNSYSSLACDNIYRATSFEHSSPPPYEQGFESRYDKLFSQYSATNETDTSSYQRHPMKERRVTWAPIPESTPPRARHPNALERTMRSHNHAYRNSDFNQSCPIHGYDGQKFITSESPNRYDWYTRSYDSRPNTSSLYEIRPSTRDIPSRYDSTRYGATEPRMSRDYLRSANVPCMIPHRYLSLSNIRSPFLDMGYAPSIAPRYHYPVNSALIPQSTLQRPKWRRSIIGLNRWSMYH
ncbi:hypothetical protein PTTG_11811 [Puccinia triticina 1-1 BBBD Race 1]|uniref:Uncharacterized protein n=2 Tax=Puccinia triticina TaxID=208348 RepID=A0A180G9W9_PUCT1|nr:uncharacterized protein PtA15_13A113 [Puccinia triticina]OAV89288.1 hypothetical protein PTTG_11811 [Puccinia triticina 1-1 BBBD Race 1]WAQ90714.1 hypothetical protein PtA15_13A113 [Puccinia triticina]WAR60902.1 hypothetical protein PtB15_13B151 [Puccinia triticina]